MQLPATVCDIGELGDLCGDSFVANDEADKHGICELWREMDADGNRDTALALLGSESKDMDNMIWGDDGGHGWQREREMRRTAFYWRLSINSVVPPKQEIGTRHAAIPTPRPPTADRPPAHGLPGTRPGRTPHSAR